MIVLISYGDKRLAITVQPSKEPLSQPSMLLLAHSLSKAMAQSLNQTFGGRA